MNISSSTNKNFNSDIIIFASSNNKIIIFDIVKSTILKVLKNYNTFIILLLLHLMVKTLFLEVEIKQSKYGI